MSSSPVFDLAGYGTSCMRITFVVEKFDGLGSDSPRDAEKTWLN
ncbi:hypothetical protein [Rhodococcus sp. BP22]|nr:hypothetical protein [Rhodococcus sp. BP22]